MNRLEWTTSIPKDPPWCRCSCDASRTTAVVVEDTAEDQLSKVGYAYDELGRLETETQELEDAGSGETITYEYDLVGNVEEVDYPGGTDLSFERDDLYRVKRIIDDDNPTVAVAAYTYNKAGEPTQLVLRNGARTAYTYDEVGRLESLINYDPDDWVISSCGYVRNDVGCPTRITYQDGRRRDYAYDDLYRLTSEEHSDAQANSLLWHNYIYDEAGNRLKKLYDSDNEQTADRYTYVYDALNQLSTLTATGTPGDRIDVAGTVADDNLTSVTVYNTTLDPDGEFAAQLRKTLFIARSVDVEEGANDLYALALDKSSNESRYPATGYHTVTLADQPDPNLEYIFDDNGCLILIVEDTTTLKEYSYDSENRLVDVKHGGILVARFQYDALGRRVIVRLYDEVGALESERRFIYDGGSVIEEYVDVSSTWVFATAYIHGLGIDNVLALTHDANGAPSNYSYYHYDGIGSVTELTDSNGDLAQAYEYDAWGIATIYDTTDTTIRNPYLFTGRRWDAGIALYYYRARHYDAALGRFLQTDPAGYDAGINLYLYVGSTPTAFVDPSGMDGDEPDWESCKTDDEVYEMYHREVYLKQVRGSVNPGFVPRHSGLTIKQVLDDMENPSGSRVSPWDSVRELRRAAYGEESAEYIEKWEKAIQRRMQFEAAVMDAATRILGGLEGLGGVSQVVVGALACKTVVGAIPGGMAILYGAEHAASGFSTVVRGKPFRPMHDAAVGGMEKLGVNRNVAEGFYVGGDLASAVASGAIASRAGRGTTTYADETGEVLEESHRLRALSKPSPEKLAANLKKAGIKRPGLDRYAAHHIVAGKHPDAARAREILVREGIDINDAMNGVFLPTTKGAGQGAYHPSLHTKKYFKELTIRLEQCEKGTVRDELKRIAEEVAQDSFPH